MKELEIPTGIVIELDDAAEKLGAVFEKSTVKEKLAQLGSVLHTVAVTK